MKLAVSFLYPPNRGEHLMRGMEVNIRGHGLAIGCLGALRLGAVTTAQRGGPRKSQEQRPNREQRLEE